jgi:hypothetical protein
VFKWDQFFLNPLLNNEMGKKKINIVYPLIPLIFYLARNNDNDRLKTIQY